MKKDLPLRIAIVGDASVTAAAVRSRLEEDLAGWELEFATAQVDYRHQPALTEVKEYVGDPALVGEVLPGATALVVHLAPVTESALERADALKVIACARGGPANINLAAATKRGIAVLHTPERNATTVAEFTLGLILAMARRIPQADHMVRTGRWQRAREGGWDSWIQARAELQGPDLDDKTLGICGFGIVGRRLATISRPIFASILAYDPLVDEGEMAELGVPKADLGDLLRQSDFVSLHVRLPARSPALLGSHELGLMKKGAYLINTSRPSAVDEAALVEALSSGRVGGAALDVFGTEPLPPTHPLCLLPNVLLAPHIAGYSKDMPARSVRLVSQAVASFLKGERIAHIMNPEVPH